MKWRDMLVGSIATLIVTILSGVAVFYMTRIPAEKPSEILRYIVGTSASFESTNNQIALVTVSIINIGNAKAEFLLGSISFPFGSIKDKKITPSAGKVSGFSVTSETSQQIDFSMPTIHPKEKVSISFLLESAISPEPIIALKSAKSIGKELSISNSVRLHEIPLSRTILSAFIPPFFGLGMILVLLLILRFRLLPRLQRRSSLNNNGFVFLHKGLTDIAENLLLRAVETGKEGPLAISNYASCLAVAGKSDEAMKFIQAAEFLARSPHEKAVAAFNHAIICLIGHDHSSALQYMKNAIGLSRDVASYCRNSTLFDSLTKDSPEIRGLIGTD